MKIIAALTLATTLLLPTFGVASPTTDALGQCLGDNTSGKDRKDLAKWIFFSMAAHPEISLVAPVPAEPALNSQQVAGLLFTRLMGVSCAKEMRATLTEGGSAGVHIAFEFLGKIAMQELMSNPEVNAAMSGFERFLDAKQIERAMRAE